MNFEWLFEKLIRPVGLLVIFAAVATYLGIRIAKRLPVKPQYFNSSFIQALGFSFAPFAVGLCSIAVLWLLPGLSHYAHLAIILAMLLAMLGLTFLGRSTELVPVKPLAGSDAWAIFFGPVFWLFLLGLLLNAWILPLLQNDSLEYMTVGRMLYESRDLAIYPVLNPESSTGFFGPWTHPPLYVSLIYLANIFQSGFENHFASRLISVWFASSAAVLIVQLSGISGKKTGYLVGLIFLATPLFFLGADSALIDALPIAGVALTLSLVLALRPADKSIRACLALGAAIGLALWTHSQSILLIPLFGFLIFFDGYFLQSARFGRVVGRTIGVLGLAILCVLPSYLRNLSAFGSLISDNPAVFALQELGWAEYFQFARGIHSISEKLQYGLFKGWFSLEAYGFAFWFALPALFVGAKSAAGAIRNRFSNSPKSIDHDESSNALVSLFLGAYLLGVVASLILGIDLMIRNERYLLIVLPAVAILGGHWISGFTSWNFLRFDGASEHPAKGKRAFPRVFFGLAITAYFVLSLLVIVIAYRWAPFFRIGADQMSTFKPQKEQVFSPLKRFVHFNFLRKWPAMLAVESLGVSSSKPDLTLSFRPADMFYSDRKMISYLDPRLIPLYLESDVDRLFEMAKSLGIRFIHAPDYFLPPISNSRFQNLIADPRFTKLVSSFDFSQIYELRDAPLVLGNPTVAEFSPGNSVWVKTRTFIIGGRKALTSLHSDEGEVFTGKEAVEKPGISFFTRERANIIFSGDGEFLRNIDPGKLVSMRGGREYVVQLQLRGHGYAKIWMVTFDKDGHMLRDSFPGSNYVQRIGEVALGEMYGDIRFHRRFVSDEHAAFMRLAVETSGTNLVAPVEAKLIDYGQADSATAK